MRHDAVAWGYARAASALGVHIIENCEVTGFIRNAAGAITGVLDVVATVVVVVFVVGSVGVTAL